MFLKRFTKELIDMKYVGGDNSSPRSLTMILLLCEFSQRQLLSLLTSLSNACSLSFLICRGKDPPLDVVKANLGTSTKPSIM